MTSLFHSSTRMILMVGLIAMLSQGALAHTYMSSVFLNGAALDEDDCVRPHPPTAYDSPIPLVSSPDMTCGWLPYANNPANRKCPIAAGSSIGIQWHHQSTADTDDIIDPSHVGPVMFYLAKSDSGAGNVWFKIYEDGYSNGAWAVNRLIANKGRVDFTIPKDIAPGNYLLRGEILALHNGYTLDGVQPYVGCVELTISGSGTANPTGVAFPGFYKDTDPGMLFNVYQSYTSYPIPGPALYAGAKSSTGSSSSAPSSSGSSSTVPTDPTPAATSAPSKPSGNPTTAPTSPPSNNNNAGGLSVQLSGGSSVWWVGVVVAGGSETTVKVEIMDSGSVKAWSALVDKSYAYVFEAKAQLKAPISVRLTSSTGKQVTLTNVFSSFASTLVNAGVNYGSTSTAPSNTPTPSGSNTPTPSGSAPSGSSSSGSSTGSGVKVTQHPGNNAWWFAAIVSGNSGAISTVEFKDSGAVTAFAPMTYNSWGYSYAALNGKQLVAPFTIRVTSVNKQVTATFSSLTPNMAVTASGQL